MALWNPYSGGCPALARHPQHPLSLADHLFDSFDSIFEVPSAWLAEMTRDRPLNAAGRTTEITNTDEQFKINLHVEDFKPQELNVKLVRDRFIVVHGKKEKKTEKEGEKEIVAHEFTRSFVIPKGVDVGKVKSNLSKEGILVIQAPKIEQPAVKHERRIAIEHGEAGNDTIAQGDVNTKAQGYDSKAQSDVKKK